MLLLQMTFIMKPTLTFLRKPVKEVKLHCRWEHSIVISINIGIDSKIYGTNIYSITMAQTSTT